MRKKNPILLKFLTAFAFTVKTLVSLRYNVKIKGSEILTDTSPLLILPNHPALIDPVILLSHIYKDTKAIPVLTSTFYDIPVLKSIFTAAGAIRVSDLSSGSRNTNVLNDISRSVLKGLKHETSIILYPGGQLAGQGFEKIFNKKSAQKIVSKLPENVKVIGVRTSGLWGSMWSKAKTGESPNFLTQLLKGIFYILANLFLFVPRRTVILEIEDITVAAIKNAQNGRKEFNLFLEKFYNVHGEEKANFTKHFFYMRS